MAGLETSNAWVSIAPPLFCSGPRSGSTLIWSPGPVRKPAPSSLLRLKPLEITVPPLLEILKPDAPAFRMVLPNWSVPVRLEMPATPLRVLLLMVRLA